MDKLWAALGLTGVQDEDVFTLAARAIDNEALAVLRELFDIHHFEEMIYTIRECEGKGWDGPLVKRWATALERAKALIAEKP
jgi:hypothetical protein